MDFGQWSALAVLVGIVLVAAFGQDVNTHESWKRVAAYLGAGVLFFGLISCVIIAAGISISLN